MHYKWTAVTWTVALLWLGRAVCAEASAAVDSSKATVDEKTKIAWYDAKLLTIEGQGWDEVQSPYDRLPAKAESAVRPPVWTLSRHSAGIVVRFATDAPTLHARWELISDRLDMPHMPATGVSGLDLYVKFEGKWRWLANGRPSGKTTTAQLVSGLDRELREYLLYLPLYNGVTRVEVGVPEGTSILQGAARPSEKSKPIVFYGTSITHGGCASRPGMVHTAIVGRWLDWPVINLGFSGNGRMEMELAKLLGEVDAAMYVIDCLPNMGPADVKERTEPLVKELRKAAPNTPILLVEDRNYTDGFLVKSKRQRNQENQKELKEAFKRLQAEGIQGVYYLEADQLLADDGEGTVDSSHPTDLGFMQHAEAFHKVIAPVLTGAGSN